MTIPKALLATFLTLSVGSTLAQNNTLPTTGNVGIGTTSPSAPLDVVNPQQTSTIINSNRVARLSSNANGADATLQITDGVANNYFLSGAQGNMYFSSGGVNPPPQMTILASGNVGIGTTSPQAPLNIVAGTVTGNYQRYNALTVAPSGGASYGENGSSMLLGSVTNHGILPVAGIWSALGSGGDGGVNYDGALVFGTVQQGNTTPSEHMRVDHLGNVGIGTTTPGAPLEVNGNVKLTANSGGSITFQDGTTQSTAYTGITCGGDYAESVDVTGNRTNYEPGDVLVLDADNPGKMLKSIEAYSTAVSGIYSTKPGTVGRRQTTAESPEEVPMAVVGIVPAKVSTESGPIKVGDLLVTSSTPGYAMKGIDRSRMLGAVVGKAMAKLDTGTGVIEVLVTLQ